MKNVFVVALLLLCSVGLVAQTPAAVNSAGGAVVGISSKALLVPLSPVVATVVGGVLSNPSGTVLISTPVIASGNVADGATFGAGGAFIVQIPSQSISY